MQAKEAKASEFLKQGHQLYVPIWQRPYTWGSEQWAELWDDLNRLGKSEDPAATHFLGSVVVRTEPYAGQPGEAVRFAVVDGQQRVATLTVLLTAIRDRLVADWKGSRKALTSDFLMNSDAGREFRRRLLLQESDDNALAALIEPAARSRHGSPSAAPAKKSSIGACHAYYLDKLAGLSENQLLQLVGLIRTRLDVVWITLSATDNAHRVFQTINAGGKALRQVDLVRNFFFLLLADRGDPFYHEHWKRLETSFAELETERYFSAWSIAQGHKGDTDKLFLYFSKDLAADASKPEHVWRYGERLVKEGALFALLLGSTKHKHRGVEFQLALLRQWGTRPAEGLLFLLLRLRVENRMRDQDLEECLACIYSFLARRFLTGLQPNLHRSIFVQVALKLREDSKSSNAALVTLLRVLLSTGSELKEWPDDAKVLGEILDKPIYSKPRRRWVASILALADVRMYSNPKLAPKLSEYSALEVEHIMPQKLSANWQADLKKWGTADPVELSRKRLHVLGNLTLSPINEDLSNLALAKKVEKIQDERLKINQSLKSLKTWTEEQIDERSNMIAKRLLDNLRRPMTEAEIRKSQYAKVSLPELGADDLFGQDSGEG